MCVCLVTLSCPTLCDPMDCSSPGSSVHGDSPGKNTEVGCHALLQRMFPTQGLNPGLLQCRQILYGSIATSLFPMYLCYWRSRMFSVKERKKKNRGTKAPKLSWSLPWRFRYWNKIESMFKWHPVCFLLYSVWEGIFVMDKTNQVWACNESHFLDNWS